MCRGARGPCEWLATMCDSLSLSRPARRARANREAAPPRPLCARFSPRLRRNGRPRANPPWLAESRTETTAPRLRLASATQARTSKIGCTPSKDQTTTMSADELREKTGPTARASALTPKRSMCPAPAGREWTPAARRLPAHCCGEAVDAAREARRRYVAARARARRIETRRRGCPPRHPRGACYLHAIDAAAIDALSSPHCPAQATSPARASRPACCTTATS